MRHEPVRAPSGLRHRVTKLNSAVTLFAALACAVSSTFAQYPEWQSSGAITILTTPEGANLPAGTVAEGFPLLVRLHKD